MFGSKEHGNYQWKPGRQVDEAFRFSNSFTYSKHTSHFVLIAFFCVGYSSAVLLETASVVFNLYCDTITVTNVHQNCLNF